MLIKPPLLLGAIFLGHATAFALGIRVPDQDAHATARGNAFVATADNPSAIYYNPAGLSQLEGHHARVGIYGVTLESRYRSPSGREVTTEDNFAAVPQLYYAFAPAEKPLAFGLGIYAPYGLSLEWPEDSGFRTLAIEGEIQYATINPVVAWEILPNLSIAAGPTFNLAEAELRRGLFAPAREFRFKGDDFDIGYNVGLLWRLHEQHALGLSYRSITTMNFEGQSDLDPFASDPAATGRLKFPQHIIAGWSYRPTPQWNFEFNVDWTDWERVDSLDLTQSFGNSSVPLGWQSSFFYEWGVTRSFENGYALSAGYIYSENSVPDETFNPIVPDSDRHIFSVGLGRRYESIPGLRWDLAYQFAYGPNRMVSGSPLNPNFFPPPAGESADGAYRFLSHAFTFSIAYQF
jgi:long-chain fatty acid transport protein